MRFFEAKFLQGQMGPSRGIFTFNPVHHLDVVGVKEPNYVDSGNNFLFDYRTILLIIIVGTL